MAKRWYVIHTYSGYENKVKADLEHRIETYGLEDRVVDIQIPTEEVTEIKDGGKRETKESKVFRSPRSSRATFSFAWRSTTTPGPSSATRRA